MKKKIGSILFAAFLLATVGCSSSTDGGEDTSDECLEDPNLPICQLPDGGPDEGSDE